MFRKQQQAIKKTPYAAGDLLNPATIKLDYLAPDAYQLRPATELQLSKPGTSFQAKVWVDSVGVDSAVVNVSLMSSKAEDIKALQAMGEQQGKDQRRFAVNIAEVSASVVKVPVRRI